MKYIILSFVLSATVAMSFEVKDPVPFKDFFAMVFTKSYDGLDKMRNPKTGNWDFEKSVSDFDKCAIRFDMERGIHVVDFIKFLPDLSTAEQFVNRFTIQVENAIPKAHYMRDNSEMGKTAITYSYSSTEPDDKAKNPEVRISTSKRDGQYMMVISVYEPLNRGE